MLEFLRNPPRAHGPEWDWNELRRSALATSLRVLQSPHDAEDAAQEAVLRAWRARARCTAASGPSPWVGRIARNEALRLGARLTARQEEALGERYERIADDAGPPEATRETAVLDALQNLPSRDAELVRLRYVEDLEYSAISERLDLPLGTVKVRLHRLHSRLRKAEDDEGIPRDF